MRQFVSISFVLALFLPFVTIFSWLSLERAALKKNVKHELMKTVSDDELMAFTFPIEDTTTQLEWEHAGEFEYGGEMYDIVRRSYSNHEVTYHVWWDHDETVLNRKLTQLSSICFNDSPVKKKSGQQLAFYTQQLFVETFSTFFTHPVSAINQHFYAYLPPHTNPQLEIDTPPPLHALIL